MGASAEDTALSPPSRKREAWLALLVALVLAAWPVRAALFDPGRVLFAVDTATAQLPWSAVGSEAGTTKTAATVANPDLADHGVQFYPFYRWVAESWLAGDPPTWCPLIYAGAPGFGNAQSGALDPQVGLLVLFEALGGRALFDWGLSFVAWLRLACALLGAYCLARRLGLDPAPAALAGVTYGFCGFLVLWLNHALGHVPPFLPWLLFFLEGLRGRRPLLSMTGAAAALALAILGGHVETAFYVGLAGGLWALAILGSDRGAGLRGLAALGLGTLSAAVLLLPTYEYLDLSAAKFIRELGAAEARGAVDLLALGVLVVLIGLVVTFVRLEREEEQSSIGTWLPGALGLGLAFGGAALFFVRRGLGTGSVLALVPDFYGKPGSGLGYRGEGTYIEMASAWIPFAALALALAAAFTRRGVLGHRRLALGLGATAFLLSVHLPGLLEVYRFVPFVGLGATVRFAPVGALMLGLLAGDALQCSTRAARTAALCVFLPLLVGLWVGGGAEPLAPGVRTAPDQDELVAFVLHPAREIDGVDSDLEGWLHPGVDVDAARVTIEELAADGELAGWSTSLPLEWHPAPSNNARGAVPAAVAAAPDGARWFRTSLLVTSGFARGHYRFTVEFVKDGSTATVGRRLAGVSTVERTPQLGRTTWVLIVLVLLVLVLGHGRSPLLAWGVVALAVIQGLSFAHRIQPAVARERVFPATRTEELLAAELGARRFFADSEVMPPNTGLVAGLRGVEGYDAMDVLAFNTYRDLMVPEGLNPLLAWHARGVDVTNPAFRLLGVGALVMREPFEHPDWELFAGPAEAGTERRAETWLYRARAPLPRAFCVAQTTSLEELNALYRSAPAAWDPLEVAGLEQPWQAASPFTHAEVGELELTNRRLRVPVELDGDGILIVTEQAFPGWKVFVDGEARPALTANLIFRAVALEAGAHEVEWRYQPASITVGLVLSAAALTALASLLLLGIVRECRGGSQPV